MFQNRLIVGKGLKKSMWKKDKEHKNTIENWECKVLELEGQLESLQEEYQVLAGGHDPDDDDDDEDEESESGSEEDEE